jgi:hypothetical protein
MDTIYVAGFDMEPVATQRTVDQVQEDDSPRFPTLDFGSALTQKSIENRQTVLAKRGPFCTMGL